MYTKKITSFFLSFTLLLSLCTIVAPAADAASAALPAQSVTAVPSDISLTLDGELLQLDAYHINGSNYFRLRDLAFVLNGTEKQFEVIWDEVEKTVCMLSGTPYSPLGEEAVPSGDNSPRQAVPMTGAILLDEHDTDFVGYAIEGSNYFKLRDIMSAVNVCVSWEQETRTVSLNTAGEYVPESSQTACGTALLDMETIAEKASSVVTLYTYDEEGSEISQGSGFFIRENGWIVTCFHVFAEPGAEVVAVTDDGKTYTVQSVLAYDIARDLALVKANGVTGATALALGNSDGLRRGQQVMSISSPYGMKNTVSDGIVSAFRIDVELRSEGLTDIQITVPVSSGSSGAPMFDFYGNVRGIIYAKHMLAENANFAIPVNDLYSVLDNLTPMTFATMNEQVAAANAAKEAEQSEPSSLKQSAAASYID